jgi:hypothetical protein
VIPAADPAIERYESALRRARTAASWPVRFRVNGLTLTPGTVMACAQPLDGRADEFLDRFAVELGADGWFEQPHGRRDIWYLNLLHFTTDIARPTELTAWVEERRSRVIGEATIDEPELIRFRHHAGPRPFMRPAGLRSAPRV